jgi:hypothetical protein
MGEGKIRNILPLMWLNLLPTLLLNACSEAPPPPLSPAQDSTMALLKDATFVLEVAETESQVTDSPAPAPAHPETERARKERLFQKRLNKKPLSQMQMGCKRDDRRPSNPQKQKGTAIAVPLQRTLKFKKMVQDSFSALLGLFRELGAQGVVGQRAAQCAEEDKQVAELQVADEREARAGAGTGDRPAEPEDEAAEGIRAGAQRGRARLHRLACVGAQAEAADHPQRQRAGGDGRADDPIHVEGLEVEHFLDAVPGDDFCPHQHPAKQKAGEKEQRGGQCAVEHGVDQWRSQGKREGNTRCVMSSPPTKKPMVAIRDAGLNWDRPMMAWPEVQPPA